MKPGEFAYARIKSLNSYNPKSLENQTSVLEVS